MAAVNTNIVKGLNQPRMSLLATTVDATCIHCSLFSRALILFIQTLALYKSFTYLLTYLLLSAVLSFLFFSFFFQIRHIPHFDFYHLIVCHWKTLFSDSVFTLSFCERSTMSRFSRPCLILLLRNVVTFVWPSICNLVSVALFCRIFLYRRWLNARPNCLFFDVNPT